MVTSEIDCQKELTYLYENMSELEKPGWKIREMRLKVLNIEIDTKIQMDQNDINRR